MPVKASVKLMSIFLTLVNRHLQDLPLSVHLPSIALLAAKLGINPLTFSVTFLAHALNLLHHPWPQLLDPDLHACASTVRALLHCSSLPTNTIARITNHVLLES